MRGKHLLIFSGVVFCFSGIGVMLWIYLGPSQGGRWNVQVQGTENLAPDEISEAVHFLLQNEQGQISLAEIESALMINPRIEMVNVEITGSREITINIKERKSCCLIHLGTQIQETGKSGKVLEENWTNVQGGMQAQMPIFYLTSNGAEKEDRLNTRGDIIRLWESTGNKYAFLWQRISEIQILEDETEIIIYPVSARARIRMDAPFSPEKLARLWAVFYFLEKEQNIALRWNEISLTEKNAVIRDKGNNGG